MSKNIGSVKKRYLGKIIRQKIKADLKLDRLTIKDLVYFLFFKRLYIGVILFTVTTIMLLTGVTVVKDKFEYYVEKSSPNLATDLNAADPFEDAQVLGESTLLPLNNNDDVRSNAKLVDKRTFVLDQYFKSRNSPLYGHASAFVEACDKYGAPKDCLTIPAIARHETDLCKYHNSAEMHNCMGWGGAGVNRMRFPSFEQHIDIATDVLVNQYGNEYLIDPSLMEKKFCGPQDECINWGNRIKKFMVEIDDFGVNLGVGRLSELR